MNEIMYTQKWNPEITGLETRVNCRPDSKSEHWQYWKTLMYRDDHAHKKLENTKRLENEVIMYLISHDNLDTQLVRYVTKHLIGKDKYELWDVIVEHYRFILITGFKVKQTE